MKKLIVIEVDEDKIKRYQTDGESVDSTILHEAGWLEGSGIHATKVLPYDKDIDNKT